MAKKIQIKKVLTRTGSGTALDKLDFETEVNRECKTIFEAGQQVIDVKYHHYFMPEGKSSSGEIAIIVYEST